MKKQLSLVLALLFLAGCAGFMSLEEREKKYGKAAPQITQSFASQEMKLGDSWKIYLNAVDPDGDMKTIFCNLRQTGVGGYPVSLIKIPEDQNKDLSGFIFLNTLGANREVESQSFTLTVQVEDKAGHTSEPSSFPLNFSSVAQQQSPPPNVFQDRSIGPILITLKPLARGD